MGLLTSGSTLASVVQDIVSFINLLIGVLAVLAVAIFFWGLVRYVYHSDDEKALAESRQTILWSLIALFVLFSLWGILALLNLALFGGTSNNGPTPQNVSSGTYSSPPSFDANLGNNVGQVPPPTPGRLNLTPQ